MDWLISHVGRGTEVSQGKFIDEGDNDSPQVGAEGPVIHPMPWEQLFCEATLRMPGYDGP